MKLATRARVDAYVRLLLVGADVPVRGLVTGNAWVAGIGQANPVLRIHCLLVKTGVQPEQKEV